MPTAQKTETWAAADRIMRKTGIIIDRITEDILTVFSLIVFLIGVYCIYDSLYLYNNAQDKGSLRFKPDYEAGEAALTLPDSIAWITLDETTVDYPVMQGEDNLEYIDKNPYGEYSLSGSIFLDTRNSPDFADDYSLIYGHHMEGGLMFGSLDKFFNADFFEHHKTGMLVTNDRIYRINVYAVLHVLSTEPLIFDPGDYPEKKIREFVEENADLYSEPKEGNLLALSTCTNNIPDNRSIVMCTIQERSDLKEK